MAFQWLVEAHRLRGLDKTSILLVQACNRLSFADWRHRQCFPCGILLSRQLMRPKSTAIVVNNSEVVDGMLQCPSAHQ